MLLKKHSIILILAFFFRSLINPTGSFGQDIDARLFFIEDTMAVGKIVGLKMTISHPEDIVVVFPGKSADFFPFELVSYIPQPTQTDDGISVDMITYEVRSFELIPQQSLSLPFLYLKDKDTLSSYVTSDTILLNKRIPEASDQLPYKTNDGIVSLEDPPNYMLIFSFIFGGIAILVILGFFLKKPLLRYLEVRKINGEWEKVKMELQQLDQNPDQVFVLEQLNDIWKKSLDPDDKLSLRAKTTTELQKDIFQLEHFTIEHHNILLKAAQSSDQVIYAGKVMDSPEISNLIRQVKQVLGIAYTRRMNDVKGITYGSAT
ncbi:MAG: hypothetical protein R3B93_07085 [Bacteroidia bacterium]